MTRCPHACACLVALALTAWGVARPAHAAENRGVIWRIGATDGDTAEMALGRDRWREFGSAFPDDATFVVGRSEARRHWPYVHPGPADAWAGSREHTFTIVFGLEESPGADSRLVVDLADVQHAIPPAWRITINAHATDVRLPPGAGDESIHGDPSRGRPDRLELPIAAGALQAGNNVISIQSMEGSWALYDSVSLEGPPDLPLAPVEPFTTITDASADAVLLRAEDGRVAQPVRVTMLHVGLPVDASLSIGDDRTIAVPLREGVNHAEILAPASGAASALPLAVRVGRAEVAARRVELAPVRRWTVYLIPHSHVDIGYTQVQHEVEKKQWENLERAIEAARRTADYPEGSRFKWNVEVMWAADSYLREASPEKQEAFIEAVRRGWIELDALYGNELTALCRPEELVRLVECAGQTARRCGVDLNVAMISDVPGSTWGIVPVLAEAGVPYFSIGPNRSDRIGGTLASWGDKPFYWVGPTGEDRVLCWIAGTGYSFFHGATLEQMGPEPMLRYLEQLDESGYPYDLVQMRYSTGGDNGPPDPSLSEFVRDWNLSHVSPRLVIATCSEMFRDFESRYGDRIPEVSGDFTPYWEDGAASSALETSLNRASAERLVQAEILFALRDPVAYPAEQFSRAWRDVLLYDEHTWGAWNSISESDAPFVARQWEIKKGFALDAHTGSEALLAEALHDPTPVGHADTIDVWNTVSWSRTDLVVVPEYLGRGASTVVRDDGDLAPSQRLATGELVFLARDVPALGARRFTLTQGTTPPAGRAIATGNSLTNGLVSLRIDEGTGAITSLRCDGAPADLVDARAPLALNEYRYVRGSDAASAARNGPVSIRVKEPGPLVASLLVESDAPGCRRLVREVRIVDGLDRVDIIDTLDKLPVREKEGVHLGFAFNVPRGEIRVDTPWAVVRPEIDQLPGACRNWLTAQRWVDVSNAEHGVTWATVDAPLIEVGGITGDRIGSLSNPAEWLSHLKPSQTFFSWVMNNHWHTNYRAEQEGPTTFRYSITTHGPFDPTAAHRFGVERSQPLLAAGASADVPLPTPPLHVAPRSVVVTSIRPLTSGDGLLIRLFNCADYPVEASVSWGRPGPPALRSNPWGEPGTEVAGAIRMPPWGIVTLRR